MKLEINSKQIKILFIVSTICLAIPSVLYIVMGRSISDLVSDFNYSLQLNTSHNLINALVFFIIFLFLFIGYFYIVKNYKKTFEKRKDIIKYIIIVAVLFTVILPMTTTDIFYYIATGWGEAKYGINPYYTSIKQLKEDRDITDDEILNKMPKVWEEQKIVYAPAWPLVCKVLSFLSFGSLPAALLIFKLFNLILHIFNCWLVRKTSGKDVVGIIYALNPLILFETLTNVHNDVLLLTFILLGIYFIFKKKKMPLNIVLGVICFAIATSIKYVPILFIPFILLYTFRKDKVGVRIAKCLGLALIFVLVLVGIYLLYAKDIFILAGILMQQGKYVKSLMLTLYVITRSKYVFLLSKILTGIFIIYYFVEVFRYLFKKKIMLSSIFNELYVITILFLIFVITGFQTWYIMWLFPLIFFQKSKNVKSILNLSVGAEIASVVFFNFGEAFRYGGIYFILMIAIWGILNVNWREKIGKNKKIC